MVFDANMGTHPAQKYFVEILISTPEQDEKWLKFNNDIKIYHSLRYLRSRRQLVV